MAEYIEREAVIERLTGLFQLQAETAKAIVAAIPPADVVEVVRGKWELDSDPGEPWRYVCNICGEKAKDTVMGKPRANFCPNCGADMRGVTDEES